MIFRELVKVFLLCLVGITGILLMAGIVAEASQQGLNPAQVLAVIPLLVPSTLPYTIPATTLFAACIVYGRLAADNEILAIRAADPSLWREHTPHLNIAYALPVTLILVSSSVTCQIGVFAAERGDVFALRRWFTLTFILGLIFVLGQANEYRTLVSEGIKINADGYGSVFYLTTGFHGLHVTGGLIAFIFYMIRTALGRFTPAQATAAIVVSYYWHFVDIVWVALFSMIYLLR